MISKEKKFEQKLQQVVSPYRATISLVDELLSERRGAQEIILLICSRLDSLANLALRNAPSQQKAFRSFVSTFSGQRRFFHRVSLGDLYGEIMYYGELMDGFLIEKPGRIQRFGPDSDKFLRFIYGSQIPITGEAASQLFNRIGRVLATHFRVKHRQRRSKAYYESSTVIQRVISAEFRSPKPRVINEALKDLIDSFRASTLLYDRYRCGVIHGYGVSLNEDDFFKEKNCFSGAFQSGFGLEAYKLEFPGLYLRNLLQKCLDTFVGQLIRLKKVPFELWTEMYIFEEMFDSEGDVFDYFDDESVKDTEEVRWKLSSDSQSK